jgi:hypothetical protein
VKNKTGKEKVAFLLEETNYKLNGSKDGYWPAVESIKEDEVSNAKPEIPLLRY